jgi:hypothetical protein
LLKIHDSIFNHLKLPHALSFLLFLSPQSFGDSGHCASNGPLPLLIPLLPLVFSPYLLKSLLVQRNHNKRRIIVEKITNLWQDHKKLTM